jgi:hypothetical protein
LAILVLTVSLANGKTKIKSGVAVQVVGNADGDSVATVQLSLNFQGHPN